MKSLRTVRGSHADVFFVPVDGPEMSFETARHMIDIVKPKLTIPIHYSNTAKYPIDPNELKNFKVPDCEVRVLADKESFEWSRLP